MSLPARASRALVFPEVTVIMGDPELPDTVKLDGQFNAEDYRDDRQAQERPERTAGVQVRRT